MRILGTAALVIFLTAGVASGFAATSASQADSDSQPTWNETMTSGFGVEYHIQYRGAEYNLTVVATNPTNKSKPSGISVTSDNRSIRSSNIRLDSGESWSRSFDVRSTLDALRTEHVVRVSTYGASRTFTFEREIDASNSSEIPTPHITDATVSTAKIDGEESTVVNVTVENPSDQLYPTKLMVHTTGTDGSFYAAIVPPGESETIAAELLDDPNSVVVGEARLYANDLNDSDGGVDQIGFEGRVDGNTRSWNESYTAIAGPWSDDGYEYQNASVERPSFAERVSGGREVRGVPVVVPVVAVLVVVLTGFVVVRRRR